jgi:hypothetical protein
MDFSEAHRALQSSSLQLDLRQYFRGVEISSQRRISRSALRFPICRASRAGHSLGGFAAATCLILCSDHILCCTAFESPGLTTFYHRLAAQRGDEDFWRARITNYLAIPNPINMCQRHLGRIIRCAEALPPSALPGFGLTGRGRV